MLLDCFGEFQQKRIDCRLPFLLRLMQQRQNEIVVLDQLVPDGDGWFQLFQLAEGQSFVMEKPERIAAIIKSNVEKS